MADKVLAVGADMGREEVRQALAQHGLDAETGGADMALVEWKRGAAPEAIVVGTHVPAGAPDMVCRHVKLHRRLNPMPIVVLHRGGRPTPPVTGIRIEPDFYIEADVAPDGIAECVLKALAGSRERVQRGVRFHIQAVMGGDLHALGDIAEMLQHVLWITKLGELAAQRVRYAALEMALNALEWGNRWNTMGGVWLWFTVYEDRFCATIADEGAGFDARGLDTAERAAAPDAQAHAREAAGLRFGGYGVRVAREFVDEVEYNAAGNVVTLVKYLPGFEKT